MNRDFKGVWIPKEIYLADLSPTKKILLAEINSLDKGEGCFASNDYLANFLQITVGRLANILSELRQSGLIIDRHFDGRNRYLSVSNPPLRQSSRKREGRVNENVNPDQATYRKEYNIINTPLKNNTKIPENKQTDFQNFYKVKELAKKKKEFRRLHPGRSLPKELLEEQAYVEEERTAPKPLYHVGDNGDPTEEDFDILFGHANQFINYVESFRRPR